MTVTAQQYNQVRTELCTESFSDFIRIVRPGYVFNWHHVELIAALQRLAERRTKRLIVMMPPRHGKSELVSRLFPAWCFGRDTNEQIITSSYSLDLASAMNRDAQRIITSDIYKAVFPNTRLSEKKEAGAVRNNSRFDILGGTGYYVSAGVGGGITGVGCTVGIIDDPVKNAQEADSVTYRAAAWEWYTTTFKTRFEPGCVEVICQTRWHEDDLTGRILNSIERDEQTEVISFPALCEQKEPCRDIGEALWVSKYDRVKLLETQTEIGSRAWNALFQQRPAPDEGALIKKAWFSIYNPRDFDNKQPKVNFYVDTAYTDKESNDPTAAIAYFKIGADYYIVRCVSKWLEFTEQVKFVKEFAEQNGYKGGSIVRVEPKATGKSLVQVMKKQTALNIREAAPPRESKVSRVNSVSAIIEAGRVHLPTDAAWVADFLQECASFPNAAHDDRVDCLTGMILCESQPKGFNFS